MQVYAVKCQQQVNQSFTCLAKLHWHLPSKVFPLEIWLSVTWKNIKNQTMTFILKLVSSITVLWYIIIKCLNVLYCVFFHVNSLSTIQVHYNSAAQLFQCSLSLFIMSSMVFSLTYNICVRHLYKFLYPSKYQTVTCLSNSSGGSSKKINSNILLKQRLWEKC